MTTRRGTTNRNDRSNVYDRAARRAFLLTKFGDGQTAPCYRCGVELDDSTITVDRRIPGALGGRYTRDNIRPACGTCNSETGGRLATLRRPRGIDLFCGAGGAAMGYWEAGFEMVGVDIAPQPNYPLRFIQADVTELDLAGLIAETGAEFIHASPPCQLYSTLAAYDRDKIEQKYADLVGPVREMLQATGLPYVIENVPRAPLRRPMLLCGAMFNGLRVYRHRAFEMNFRGIWRPEHPRHTAKCARNGYLPTETRPFMSIHGGKHSKAWQAKAAEVMGVPWMKTIPEVCEAIPPAFTQHIGSQLISQLTAGEAA